jgi:hypothetical protein
MACEKSASLKTVIKAFLISGISLEVTVAARAFSVFAFKPGLSAKRNFLKKPLSLITPLEGAL